MSVASVPMQIQPPFQWFGGKRRVAAEVWRRLGDVGSYVEPFFGSGAVLLARPHVGERTETVNDADCMVANFWRSVKHAPDAVAEAADWPCHEADLTARHVWLVNRKPGLADRMQADPDWYDAKAAGWWCWGQCWWIGCGWCSGDGPWNIGADGLLAKVGDGVNRQRPQLGDDGRGVSRRRPHLHNNLGIHSNSDGGTGTCAEYTEHVRGQMRALADRFRRVRACCGDWSRACTPSAARYTPTDSGTVGFFLDPPYSAEAGRDMGCYATDCGKVAHDVREWCKTVDTDPRLRIALCGYDTEHAELESRGWSVFSWSAAGGLANISKDADSAGKANAKRERIWFSPHCLTPRKESSLFGEPIEEDAPSDAAD